MKLACCPSCTRPTSASSTSTRNSICVRSSASVNRTGAWNVAATVCPGSTERSSTMPLIGERITAFARSVRLARSVARACATAARAAASSARARASVASATSKSCCDGTLPPLISRTFS